MFAEIIIPIALPKNYTWKIPDHFIDQVQIGIRVEVQLGNNKRYAGIIKNCTNIAPDGFTPKPILDILDDQPIIHPIQLQLWEWMATYYMCSEGEVMQAAIPSYLKMSSESNFVFNPVFELDGTPLNDIEYIVAEALSIKQSLSSAEIQKLTNRKSIYALMNRLILKGVCFIEEKIVNRFTQKEENFLILSPSYQEESSLSALLDSLTKAPKQLSILMAYLTLEKESKLVEQKKLAERANASSAQIKALIDKNILISEKRIVDRIAIQQAALTEKIALSPLQKEALGDIKTHFQKHNVCLLHGVTGSGKTQVYVSLIKEMIQKDQQALYMLPEIALTAQMVRRLKTYFGNAIAIYHSKFNPNERVEIWNKVKTGEIKIVLGARSALFLPYKNLSLIIVDEEHDPSYKQQEPAPRYQARDAAIYYANILNAKVLLGSATPSVESFYNAKIQKYGHVHMHERYSQSELPSIELIDTKKQIDNTAILTPSLLKAIKDTLAHNKQVILFQNRRGYSPYMICQTCGWIPHCKHCDVTLTYHKARQTLSCHYCGAEYPIVSTCQACGKQDFKQKNFGTEQIEEILNKAIPEAIVARMDLDNVKGKHQHDILIQKFEQKHIDILVGTQMVVKGLDFEHVDLVGIIDADSLLNFNQYRVNERAFQLMEQVSGRAGRKNNNGKVLIQLSQTQHPIIKMVQEHDYFGFYEFEIANRKHFAYPPFSRLMNIQFKHPDNQIAEDAIRYFYQLLPPNIQQSILGPAQPLVNRIRNKYIWEVFVKISPKKDYLQIAKKQIQNYLLLIHTHTQFKSVQIIIDIDPN